MGKKVNLYLPVQGEINSLAEVNDYVFSKKLMGDGTAILPEGNTIYSPVNGVVEVFYNSKHAIVIRTDEDLRVLIHVGLDTARLGGRGFGTYVNVGDRVSAGEKILFFDKEYLQMRSSLVTPVVILKSEKVKDINVNYSAKKLDDVLIEIEIEE